MVKKLSRFVDSRKYERSKAEDFYSKISACLHYAGTFEAFAADAKIGLSEAALFTGRCDLWLTMLREISCAQEKRAMSEGLATHNIRFIDSEIFYTTIGLTFNIDAWIKSGILGIRPPWRTVVLADPAIAHCAINPCLLSYWSEYIDFIEDADELRRLGPLRTALSTKCNYYLKCDERSVPFPHSSAVWIQKLWEEQGREPLLSLKPDHRARGEATLARMGIPHGAWFVVVHVREPGFKGGEGFRDSDIATYIDAMKQVTARGGWVIRLGDSSMSALPTMPKVIDYARSDFKSDWMDVFLCVRARFMIATSSGLATISHAFGVPIVMTNYLPTGTIFLGSRDLFIPRLMRRIDDGSFLNFQELMNPPYSLGVTDGMYRNILRVETIPNTTEEISGVVEEMLESLEDLLSYSAEDDSLQLRFDQTSANWAAMICLPDYKVRCRAGRDFLRRHSDLLPQPLRIAA